MGNRAIITSAPYRAGNVAIYIHWNGGRESIEGFCAAAKHLGFRAPSDDYGMARLCQIIGQFFGGELSLGVGICRSLIGAADDNGAWIISDDWTVIENRDWRGKVVPLEPDYDSAKASAIADEILAKVKASEAAKAA